MQHLLNLKNVSFYLMIFVFSSMGINAQNYPGWRGINRDGNYSQEKGLLKKWAENGPELLWETEEVGKGFSSPVIVGDKMYITGLNEDGSKEVFSALNVSGKRLYQIEYGSPWKQSFPENRTTPTIVGNKAYVVSGTGEVVCINLADGKIFWSVDGRAKFGKKEGIWGTAESPLVIDGKVIYTPGGETTNMVALNAETGETIWQTKSLTDISSYVSPLLVNYKGKKQIVGITGMNIFGVNPENGDIQWTFTDWATQKKSEHDGKICANTPLFKDGKLYVSNGYDIGSFMLQLSDDLKSVSLLWRNNDLDTHIGGFVLTNGIIYGSNWINNNNGDWVAVDWESGETKYITPWGSGKGKGSIVTADGMLYCYDERRGTVGLATATPEKFDIVSEMRIAKGEGPYWAHPVIHNGTLYMRHGAYLAAYKIK